MLGGELDNYLPTVYFGSRVDRTIGSLPNDVVKLQFGHG